jgi:uncharacterized repeat protein (TIGR04138 family)
MMKRSGTLKLKLYDVVRHDPRYSSEAYLLCLEAARAIQNEGLSSAALNAREILRRSLDQAIETYGPMARSVLSHWGVVSPQCIKNIVLKLSETGAIQGWIGEPVPNAAADDRWDSFFGISKDCIFENIRLAEEEKDCDHGRC